MKNKIITAVTAIIICRASLAQNVGIGLSDPTRAKLEVNGAVDMTAAIFGGDGQGISLLRNIPGIGFNSYFNNGMRLMQNGTGALQYYVPDQGMMAWDISLWGNAGQAPSAVRRVMAMYYDRSIRIGELGNRPEASLWVERGEGINGTAVFAGTTHGSFFNYNQDENTYIRAGKDNGTVFINDIPGSKVAMYGSIGINTAAPHYPLEIWQPNADKGLNLVNTNNWVDWEWRVTGSLGWLQMYYNGSFTARFNQNGVYSYVSDRRLKKNIETMTPVLDKVMQLEPVRYEMKENNPGNEKSIGFIAQDVKAIFPELVYVGNDTASGYKGLTDLHSISYSDFGVIAIKAIQEQQLLITALQAELDELRKMINELRGKEKYLTINQ